MQSSRSTQRSNSVVNQAYESARPAPGIRPLSAGLPLCMAVSSTWWTWRNEAWWKFGAVEELNHFAAVAQNVVAEWRATSSAMNRTNVQCGLTGAKRDHAGARAAGQPRAEIHQPRACLRRGEAYGVT
jgi:hypothetical protein